MDYHRKEEYEQVMEWLEKIENLGNKTAIDKIVNIQKSLGVQA